jgi:hypothetical protein
VLQGPHDTLRRYSRAIDEGRAEEAYALLSTEAKRGMSLEAFRRILRESPEEMKEMAHSLARSSSTPIVKAKVTTAQGEELILIYEHGSWRIDGDSIDLYSQMTPKQTVKSFLRAMKNKRYDILLRFVPDDKKVASESVPALNEERLKTSFEGPQKEEMSQIAQGLEAAMRDGTAIETIGDRATLPYGAGDALQMVREHGLWKIEAF